MYVVMATNFLELATTLTYLGAESGYRKGKLILRPVPHSQECHMWHKIPLLAQYLVNFLPDLNNEKVFKDRSVI